VLHYVMLCIFLWCGLYVHNTSADLHTVATQCVFYAHCRLLFVEVIFEVSIVKNTLPLDFPNLPVFCWFLCILSLMCVIIQNCSPCHSWWCCLHFISAWLLLHYYLFNSLQVFLVLQSRTPCWIPWQILLETLWLGPLHWQMQVY
jgi:hypothetical protein